MATSPILNLYTHEESYVSVSELAAYWTVSERTIYRDIQKGALKVVRVGSAGTIRVPIEAARLYGRPVE